MRLGAGAKVGAGWCCSDVIYLRIYVYEGATGAGIDRTGAAGAGTDRTGATLTGMGRAGPANY